MPIPPGYVPPKAYKVKKTDNALTLPGRSTFPQGSYVPKQLITPYQMSTGTQASGVAGPQGASSAMYPSQGGHAFQAMNDWKVYTDLPARLASYKNIIPNGPGVPPQIQAGFNQSPPVLTGANNFGAPNASRLAFNNRMANTPGAGSIVSQQAQVPGAGTAGIPGERVFGVRDALGNAAPYGLNSYGQRVDASGGVWDPTKATTDIYGGRFIQPGERKWERINGRLQQVEYGRNGKKKVLSFRDRVGRDEANRLESQSRNTSNAGRNVSSQFVSFRV